MSLVKIEWGSSGFDPFARILHEEFEFWGQAGKTGWTIASGYIAIVMDHPGLCS